MRLLKTQEKYDESISRTVPHLKDDLQTNEDKKRLCSRYKKQVTLKVIQLQNRMSNK